MNSTNKIKKQLNQVSEKQCYLMSVIESTTDTNLIKMLEIEFNQLNEHREYLMKQIEKENAK
jgi:hypothetical protein